MSLSYLCITYHLSDISHSWSAKKYIIPVIIISFCYNSTKFLELNVLTFTEEGIIRAKECQPSLLILNSEGEKINGTNSTEEKLFYQLRPTVLRWQ